MTKIQADWLFLSLVQDVIASLGAEKIRFVGGAVRDTLVGRPIIDIDAATQWLPEETRAKLEAAQIKVIPTGLQHGTVTAVRSGQSVEITTLRRDEETDGRHAKVAFTDDWLEDAKRRDFTMNAMYLSADGSLFDPFGGQADLLAGRVRFIGNAEERIHEDALRILRFFRFHAHYGRDGMDAKGLAAAKANASMLERLSAERVRDEICKLLAAPDPMPCVRGMCDADIWGHTPVVDADADALEALLDAERLLGVEADILMRLGALVGSRAPSVGRLLKMPNRDVKLLSAISHGMATTPPDDARRMRVFLYRFGVDAGLAMLLSHETATRAELLKLVLDWEIPALPVRGRDLIQKGMEPGPAVSETLKRLEERWIDSDFTLSKAELLSAL